jgi:N-acylneuraminate cytidylyltransferase/CMP-N,N'-diacetyllegionaminic acid synthase
MTSSRRLALVCARGGSKGVPGKNLWSLHGESLVSRAVRQALESNLFEIVAVSSDDELILDHGRRAGAQRLIRRPQSMASDTAGKLDVIRHALGQVERDSGTRFDTVVDLDVTTPLRTTADIRDVVRRLEAEDVDVMLTASKARRSPYFNLVELDDEGVPRLPSALTGSVVRRQDSPPVFDLSGAVYAWRRTALESNAPLLSGRSRLHVLPPERAWDVDGPMDLLIIEALADSTGSRSLGTREPLEDKRCP